ncbi:MAG TPA: Hsp70 family protein, partial [Devosia sp.]|nr:Hsp70 family protein [Devosia sp.]
MNCSSCGLDFGTSNSTLGLVDKAGVPFLVPLEGEALQLPSVLFFSFEDDRIYFGQSALDEYVSGAEGRIMRALKSVLGTSLMKDETRIRGNRLA